MHNIMKLWLFLPWLQFTWLLLVFYVSAVWSVYTRIQPLLTRSVARSTPVPDAPDNPDACQKSTNTSIRKAWAPGRLVRHHADRHGCLGSMTDLRVWWPQEELPWQEWRLDESADAIFRTKLKACVCVRRQELQTCTHLKGSSLWPDQKGEANYWKGEKFALVSQRQGSESFTPLCEERRFLSRTNGFRAKSNLCCCPPSLSSSFSPSLTRSFSQGGLRCRFNPWDRWISAELACFTWNDWSGLLICVQHIRKASRFIQ